ncbi:UNVERIFIED_CONTAM: hypothetical protein Sindi_2578600 [Sesamum indicum]
MLDKVIEYLRQLQAQVHMMGEDEHVVHNDASSHAATTSDVYDASHGNGHWHGQWDGLRQGHERYKSGGWNVAIYSTHRLFHAPTIKRLFAGIGGFSISRPFICISYFMRNKK